MNHLSNSRYNLDHFGTSSPPSEIERPRPPAGGPTRNDETRAELSALQRLLLRPLYQLYEIGLQRQVCIQLRRLLPPLQRFRLTFRLLQWRWQLVAVILPETIQNLLGDELVKATRTR